uniref:Peptidase A1 domain-containing protein n=1 Tax=Angiostrongylus cantonensis TaxID=6313 RepID=A0A0K0DK52_ANGCA
LWRTTAKAKWMIEGPWPEKWTFLYGDYEFVGNITIADQEFAVMIDTGSVNLWFPGIPCNFSCDLKRRFKIHYGPGAAEGFFGTDVTKFGRNAVDCTEQQLAVPDTTFGIATNISGDFSEDPTDEISGLAFSSIVAGHVKPPLISAIYQNLTPGGLFTYGAIDTTNCGPVIEWRIPQGLINAESFILLSFISDTGTTFIGQPKMVADRLAKAAGASYSTAEESCLIPCNATPGPIDITFGRNIYSVQYINYIIRVRRGDKCLLDIFPHEKAGFEPTWVLGDPFIRQFCNIYDIGYSRIGFATSLKKRKLSSRNARILFS